MPVNYSLPNHQRIGNRVNFTAWLNNMRNNDLGILTNGTSGTFAGYAGKGCLLIDTTNGNLYMNAGTKASPVWTPVSNLTNSLIQTNTTLLTNAQIKAIRATPITLIPAPGVGFFIYPIECVIELVYGGNNAFTANVGDNLAIKWKDGSGAAIHQGGVQAFLQNTASAFNKFVDQATTADVNALKTVVDNQPLVMHNIGAAEIAGNAANDNTINVITKYSIQISL